MNNEKEKYEKLGKAFTELDTTKYRDQSRLKYMCHFLADKKVDMYEDRPMSIRPTLLRNIGYLVHALILKER